MAALSIAALPTDRFCFEGFLPARPAARRARLDELGPEPRTLVFYEAPHRVREMLEDCARILGPERPATVAREITKLHETPYRGSLSQLALRAAAEADFARGEIVLVVAGAPRARRASLRGAAGALDRVLKPLLAELPLKQAARLAAQITRCATTRRTSGRCSSNRKQPDRRSLSYLPEAISALGEVTWNT